MNDQKGNIYSDILKSLSSVSAIALPVLQFLQALSAGQIYFVDFLGDKTIIFTTSLLAFLISLFVLLIFKSNPYFRFPAPFQGDKKEKWLEYLKKTDTNYNKPEKIKKVKVVPPPFEITADILNWIMVPLFVIAGYVFIWLGLEFRDNPTTLLIICQSIAYTLTVVSAVYVLSALTTKLSERDKWKVSQVSRIKKAINLAKEHDGFGNFPKINFLRVRTEWMQGIQYLIVEVSVGDSQYSIVTDTNAEILHAVSKIKH